MLLVNIVTKIVLLIMMREIGKYKGVVDSASILLTVHLIGDSVWAISMCSRVIILLMVIPDRRWKGQLYEQFGDSVVSVTNRGWFVIHIYMYEYNVRLSQQWSDNNNSETLANRTPSCNSTVKNLQFRDNWCFHRYNQMNLLV